jgi:hypothetical protein
MSKKPLFTILGLDNYIQPIAPVAALGLWVGLCTGLILIVGMPLSQALWLGGLLAITHYVFALIHDLGHAFVARRVGYPMIGLTWGTMGIFAGNIYPANEPPLPAKIHIQRALGGPIISAVATLIAGLFWSFTTRGSWQWWWLGFMTLENGLIYTAQMLVPLGFNDGATLYKWLPKLK